MKRAGIAATLAAFVVLMSACGGTGADAGEPSASQLVQRVNAFYASESVEGLRIIARVKGGEIVTRVRLRKGRQTAAETRMVLGQGNVTVRTTRDGAFGLLPGKKCWAPFPEGVPEEYWRIPVGGETQVKRLADAGGLARLAVTEKVGGERSVFSLDEKTGRIGSVALEGVEYSIHVLRSAPRIGPTSPAC